jgi:hypothetical protein
MDRFAFLAAQPWLYPTRREDAREDAREDDDATNDGRDEQGAINSDARDGGRHRSLLPPRLVLETSLPARTIHDGVCSFHFSEEQYLPPSSPRSTTSGEGGGAASTTVAVVGAASADAIHMAFSATRDLPDMAQFRCVLRAREVRDASRDSDGSAVAREASPDADGGARRRTRAWLELRVDGRAYAMDVSQVRYSIRKVFHPPPGFNI